MPPPRRTQQERRDQAEAALLTAAAELVVEQGVRSLTLARVGEKTNNNQDNNTHHNNAKQALVERLARATQAGFVPGLEDAPSGLDRLLRLDEGYLGEQGRLGVFNQAILVLWAEAATQPELAPIFRERDAALRADLSDDVEAGIADGTIDPGVTPAEDAVAIVGQLRGIALQRLLDPRSVDTERLRRGVTGYWRRTLGLAAAE